MLSALRATWRLLRPSIRPHRWALGCILLLGAVAAFSLRAPFLLLDPLWNRVIAQAPSPTSNPAQAAVQAVFERLRLGLVAPLFGLGDGPQDETLSVLFTVGLAVIVIALAGALAHYGLHCLSRWVALKLAIDLRERLTEHLLGLSMRYHGSRRFGDLISRTGEDVSQTLVVVRECLKELVLEPLLVVFSLGISTVAAPLPTLVVVALFLPISLPLFFLSRRVRRRSRKSLGTLGSSMQVLTEILQGIRTVKAFRAEGRELERYRRINERYLDHTMGLERTVALARASTILLSHSAMALLVVAFCWLSLRLDLFESGSQWMQFFGGLALTYTHVRHVLNGLTRVQSASGAADRLSAVLAEREDVVEIPGAQAIESLGSGLRFEGVSFSYPEADADAIGGLDLGILPGQTLALVGPSGAGKSTLLDLVARFIDPREGRVSVDGRDLREVRVDDWVALWAMVGQVPFLFHASIEENIRYGRPGASSEEVVAAARAANVHDFILSLPQGYATEVGEAGAKLSGGQRQRITIARAILKRAPLLLLDEATSALDTESEALVQDALENLMQGRTVVVIAHRLSTIRGADRIAVLDQGRLVQLGTHDELIEKDGVYARLFAMQDGAVSTARAAGAGESAPGEAERGPIGIGRGS